MKVELVKTDENVSDILKNKYNVMGIANTILANRLSYKDIRKKKYDLCSFIYSTVPVTYNIDKLVPYKTVEYLSNAINKKEKILVVTDYDCDGITSAVTLYRSLTECFKIPKELITVVVNKRINGNGFNRVLMGKIKELYKINNYGLMITADHGSSNYKEMSELLEETNMNIILTDHHQVPLDFPNEVKRLAFVNNHKLDSEYKFDISGCTVALLTMIYCYTKINQTDNYDVFYKIFPYAAISIISDVMNCKHPVNRSIFHKGMKYLNSDIDTKWVAIKKAFFCPNVLDSKTLSYRVTPVVNTGNRTDSEEEVYSVFTSSILEDFDKNLNIVLDNNEKRKQFTKELIKDILKSNVINDKDKTLVFVVNTGNISVGGVVANKLGEMFNKPTICFSKNGDILNGSCRGVLKDLDIVSIFNRIQERSNILIKFGGHKGAGGLTIKEENLAKFMELFENVVTEDLNGVDTEETLLVDKILKPNEINLQTCDIIRQLGPYGKEFPEPLFMSKLTLQSVIVFNDELCQLRFKLNNIIVQGMYFFKYDSELNAGNIKELLPYGCLVDVVYNLDVNYYKDIYDLNMSVKHIERSLQ